MTFSVRTPDNCRFREPYEGVPDSRWACRFVSRVIGRETAELCSVNQSICEACCQQPLPEGPALNSVLAALVYSATEHPEGQSALSVRDRSQLQQTRQFAMRWLARVENEQRVIPLEEYTAAGEYPTRSLCRLPRLLKNVEDVRIGLVGSAVGYGLAYQNRDLTMHLGIDRWLIDGRAAQAPPDLLCRHDSFGRDPSPDELENWMDGLDAVLFVERPVFANMTRIARQLGVRVVCVPNWEWLSPEYEWLDDVDVMLCPTEHTTQQLLDWKRRFGFKWDVISVSWPIDTERFQFRERQVCRRFVYVHGSGGYAATRLAGSGIQVRRKGLDVLLAAARLIPEVPFIVYAFPKDVIDLPANVERRQPPDDNRFLYFDGDVCVQPSRWEGLGLPLLECQAAGLPLITTDIAPMNEHRPLAVIPAQLELVQLTLDLCIPAAAIEPEDLAAVLKSVHGRRIRADSRRAREFVVREHSWKAVGSQIRGHIHATINSRHRD